MELVSLDFNNLDPESLNGVTVRKHNDLIEARYQLPSLQEQRVIHMLLAQIKPDDEDFKGYKILVSDFAKIVGIRADTLYSQMDAITLALRSRNISIRNGKNFLHTGWLSSAKYIHGSGYVELAFDPNLKPYLLQLKDHFTQYKLDAVLHFKSVYSIRLYELLKKEAFKAKKNHQFEAEYSYEFLRESFGIEKNEYKLFADFKRFTVQVAVTEIYDKTELNIFDVQYKKTGRAVSHIVFRVEIREPAEAEVRAAQIRLEDQPKEKENGKEVLQKELVELGYSFEAARRDVNKYGIKRIKRSIAYTLAKQQAGAVKDFPAYLSRVIADDLGDAIDQIKTQKAEAAKVKQQTEKQAQVEQERQEKAIKEKHNKALEFFYNLPEGLQTITREEFYKTIEDNTFVVGKWRELIKKNKDPIRENILIKSSFTTYLIEQKIFS